MKDLIYNLINNVNIPILSAFLLGILTSISPCPLATNITAIAYVSQEIKNKNKTLLNGFLYTLGRIMGYTLISMLIFFGFSSFKIANIFQGWGEKILGPILIIISLIMFDVIKINFNKNNLKLKKIQEKLAKKEYLGPITLGLLFSLAFCPYSGIIFFSMLIPLILNTNNGLLLSPVFGFGTGLPVIIFAFILAFSIEKLNKFFQSIQKIEKVTRYVVATTFFLAGLYYSWITLQYFILILNS